ncbi:MAG: cadherin-like domain-containing protein [Deltaproteobacteria bacterium]|nr:cadherin-like domain-containing protein [Deltaproteobacteria bacterium]
MSRLLLVLLILAGCGQRDPGHGSGDPAPADQAQSDGDASALNTAPVAVAQQVTTAEDEPIAITLVGTDADDDPLTFAVTVGPGRGSVALDGNVATYTPAAEVFGADQLTFVVSDGVMESAPASVSITIDPRNDGPVAVASVPAFAVVGRPAALKSASYDVDDDALVFAWSAVSGPAVSLDQPAAAAPSFVPTAAGLYVFSLLVDDGRLTATTQVSVGVWDLAAAYHSLALAPDATLWSWGYNAYGQLGDGDRLDAARPRAARLATQFARVFAGGDLSLGLGRDGSLWAWGYGGGGQLGDGCDPLVDCEAVVAAPRQVLGTGAAPYDSDWRVATAGYGHVLALKEDGTLWAWGDNFAGQLGVGDAVPRSRPTEVLGRDGVTHDGDWAAVAAGGSHSLALKTDGTLWAWGGNLDGQLGTGCTPLADCVDSWTPVEVAGGGGGHDRDWSQVTAGYAVSAAVKQDGTSWTWGAGASGQLGDGCVVGVTCAARGFPGQVVGEDGVQPDADWAAVAAQAETLLLRKRAGSLWAVGYDGHGELGDGSATDRSRVGRIGVAADWIGLAAGVFHALAVRETAGFFAWGMNRDGALGNGEAFLESPTRVDGSTDWAAVAAGRAHALATKTDGSLWAWGANADGELGDGCSVGSDCDDALVPTRVGADTDWAAAAAGHGAFSAGRRGGALWLWGAEQVGELASGCVVGFCVGATAPAREVLAASNWVAVAAGAHHALGLQDEGAGAISLWSWGGGEGGALGHGDQATRTTPTRVGSGVGWSAVAARLHSLAARTDGSVWAWGPNQWRQLGDGTSIDRYSPRPVCLVYDSAGASCTTPLVGAIAGIAVGDAHSLAVVDGEVWSWGLDDAAALGRGTATGTALPGRVCAAGEASPCAAFLDGAVQVAAGGSFSVARRADGSLWAWGTGSHGVLGTGRSERAVVPVQVGTDSDWAAVSAGSEFVLAIKRDGTLWAWGDNGRGRLGVGSPQERALPVAVTIGGD